LNQEAAAQGAGATLLAAYEDLRREVLGGLNSKGLGLCLFLGQGMAAWMKACSAILVVPSSGGMQPAVPVTIVADLQSEVIRILASMAFGKMESRSF